MTIIGIIIGSIALTLSGGIAGYDVETFECGGGSVAVDIDADGNSWAYCEPA